MGIPRIYTRQHVEINSEIELERSASRHLLQVLRLKEKAVIILFNGKGGEYRATINQINKNSVTALPSKFSNYDNESTVKIHLGICMSRGERMDQIIQKSTELGVAEITPIISERTQFRLKVDRKEKKLDHWQHIAISACEQSGRNIIPPINEPQKIGNWIKLINVTTLSLIHI